MTNELRRPDVLPNKCYIDLHKMEKLTELIHELIEKIDVKPFGVDVGKANDEPLLKGWYSVIVLPFEHEDTFYELYPELHEAAQDVINYAKTMTGLERIAINILEPGCLLPLHYDNWTNADDMGNPPHYNILVPLNGKGHSVVNDKLYVNEKDVPIIFDPQSYHGGFNSTYEDRYNYFVKVKNEAFTMPKNH